MFIIGKIKTYLIAALAVLLPILYFFGRKDGAKLKEADHLADDLAATREVAEFYKAMAEHEDDFNPTDRNDLVERVRNTGL